MKKVVSILFSAIILNPLPSYSATDGITVDQKKKVIHHHRHHYKKHKIYHPIEQKKMKDELTKSPETNKATSDNTTSSGISGQFALTTNYMFRGISQSSDNPAVQGGLTYTFPVGLYANVWGSNVNFPSPDGKTATAEFDTIVGWRGGIGDNFTYDINIDRYNYPGARTANYNELNTLFNYKIIQIGVSYSADYSGTHATGIYYNGTLSYDIPAKYTLNIQDINVQAEMGHYSLAKLAGNSYNDYSLTLNKKINTTYTVTAQWTGTNGRAKNPPFDGNQLVGTVTASF